jgi:hypothetical protein
MTDAKPYTVEDLPYLTPAEVPVWPRIRATVEALARVTKERDEARTMHDLMAAEKERAEHAHNELVLSLPAMRRDVAEKQREACAARVRHLDADPDVGFTSAEILATPLVTDSTEREVERE